MEGLTIINDTLELEPIKKGLEITITYPYYSDFGVEDNYLYHTLNRKQVEFLRDYLNTYLKQHKGN